MPGPAAHSGASAPADGRDEKKSEQRSSPKGSSTSGNPSVTAAPCQLPLHKGALGTGDADCRVGPAGLLAMAMVFCHSGERSDVGIRPFYDERGFGPMYLGHGLRRPNFVPKFGRRSWASAPTPCGGRHAGSSCPTGGCGGLHQLPGGNRRAAKRPRPQPRGMGGNRRKNHPKRRTAPATTQAALSEAESAEREAGQIQSLPDDLRVQHGAEGSEVSAKPRPCPRRGCITE